MKWEILILTQPSRVRFLEQLLEILGPMPASVARLVFRQFDPRFSLGQNREIMRREASADYISFLDDDDFVPRDFVPTILPLLDGVDQVSFDVQIYQNERPYTIARHTLTAGGWYEKAGTLYRDVSHVHPMRRELALEVPMSGGIGEDFRWAAGMRGRVKTEHHIDRPMYYYLWRTRKDDTKDQVSPTRRQIFATLKNS